jgi:hypothetical protein
MTDMHAVYYYGFQLNVIFLYRDRPERADRLLKPCRTVISAPITACTKEQLRRGF